MMASITMTARVWRGAWIMALCGSMAGCATIRSLMGDDENGHEINQENELVVPAVKPVMTSTVPTPAAPATLHRPPTAAIDPDELADLQLKVTRLLARAEELEEKFSRQQERLQIIERGLTLGIVPDELQTHSAKGSKAGAHGVPSKATSKAPVKKPEVQAAANVQNHDEADEEADGAADQPAAKDSKEASIAVADRDEFNKAFAAAHEDFRAGRFGKAIVGFSEVGKKFDPGLTSGVHQFWIARSWTGLKEMQTSRQLFTEFIAAYPQSPWAPRAKLELARVESALGLKETAVKRLRGVISEHPLEDVAEMAKAEIERMSKTL